MVDGKSSSKWKRAIRGIIRSSWLASSHLIAAAVPATLGEVLLLCASCTRQRSGACLLEGMDRNKEVGFRKEGVKEQGNSCHGTTEDRQL